MNLRILSPAHDEIVIATNYLQKLSGMGWEFNEQVYSKLDSIEADPNAFPLWELNSLDVEIRRVMLQRFRYVIYFQIVLDEVIILAIRHTSQDYKSWMNRIRRNNI